MSNFQEKYTTTHPGQKSVKCFLENLSQKAMFSLFQPSDHGIYWKINNERFHQYFRDKMLVAAINSKIDQVGPS